MPGQNLTRDETRERARLLDVSSYDVDLDVTAGDHTFPTTSTVRFTCTEPGASSWIDFVGESVGSVRLNGVDLDPEGHYDGARITLPDLAAENELAVSATGRYMNTGEGLHRFVDPVDDEVYLYTQFEVADCRRVFAVFEQPDLKATFTFTVTAPAGWQIVSTQPTPEPEAADGGAEGAATWRFAPTPRLSCYVTALVAGPYDVVRDELTTGDGRVVPLGLFCRRSLSPFLDSGEVFDITRRGFAFYEKEFGLAYPFEKYDQIFTPEFNAGAMENVGAVTYHEMYVFRSKVSEATVERRALTILHELAHMWFGNLVTMRWWDDLWLNESFAEWASTTCQAEATRWTSAWTTFGTAEKAWAYNQDQLSSTHPIVAQIRDLHDVEVNFDGITYAKGASVLKQLVAYVGREAFTQGLRAYFAAHAWGNTTLADLLAELERASGRDLSAWSRDWLETSGVNTLRPALEVGDDGALASVAVEQTGATPQMPLRPHRLAVGLYDLRDGRFVRSERVELDVAGARTDVPELVGRPRPDLFLVNDDDLAYAKIRLDAPSLSAAVAHARGFTDSLPRALVLGAAWDMTRDAQMRARDFVRLALDSIDDTTDPTMLRVLLAQVRSAVTFYTAPDARDAAAADVTARLREMAQAAPAGGDAQFQLAVAFAGWARGDDDLDLLASLLEGSTTWPGLEVDTEMRWVLLTGLAAGGRADADAIEAERRRDDTATGRERAVRALAARPSVEAKESAWAGALDSDAWANQTLQAAARGWGAVHDTSLLEPFVDRYHTTLLDVAAGRTHAIMETLVSEFYPLALADEHLARATQDWLDAHPDAQDSIRRLVAENRDAVVRALAAQAFDADAS
ncbi:aminopeptidase N [Agilicoccus flavus]|uniref:aminopeptidase N n=1 Tax=Agilicoccus flavus TaxID=2775968 RepID=UPI001CF633FB|nr:aminopeptidase N [Agilicoccus flavus]